MSTRFILVAGAIGRHAWVTYPVREGKVKTQVKTQVLASRIILPQRDLFFHDKGKQVI